MIVHGRSSILRRARRARILIVGCGDVGLRVARLLVPRCHVFALTSSPERVPMLRAAGITPLVGDLDRPESLGRFAAIAPRVVHLAPPPASGRLDPRTRALMAALARAGVVQSMAYVGTTGVYGDAGGAWVDECRKLAPQTDRAHRRVDAEQCLRSHARLHRVRVSVLRAPGIYATDRVGGDPVQRVRDGTPLLRAQDDVYTNRIHADDLARACVLALLRGMPLRAVNVCDDVQCPMGDYYDAVADHAGLPRLPRIDRAEALRRFSPITMSFLSESRRLSNRRMKRELRLVLEHPRPAALGTRAEPTVHAT
jgi:nucleoside-diphosphate-sugar epimerase